MHLNHLHLFGKPKRQQTLPLTRGASMHNAVQLYLSYIYLQFAVLASHSYIVESFLCQCVSGILNYLHAFPMPDVLNSSIYNACLCVKSETNAVFFFTQ